MAGRQEATGPMSVDSAPPSGPEEAVRVSLGVLAVAVRAEGVALVHTTYLG